MPTFSTAVCSRVLSSSILLLQNFCHVGLVHHFLFLRICSTGSLDVLSLDEDADLVKCALKCSTFMPHCFRTSFIHPDIVLLIIYVQSSTATVLFPGSASKVHCTLYQYLTEKQHTSICLVQIPGNLKLVVT